MTKKQSIVTICIATMLIVGVMIGASYAYWRQTLVQTGTNELTTGCFNISLTEEQNEINLQKAFPISDEAMTGYIKVDGTWKYGNGSLAFSDNNGWPYSNNDTIDIQSYDGPVKTAINAYKEILPEGVEVRLITKAEIEALVNDGATLSYGYINDKADAKGVSWIYSTSYWSGSASAVNASDAIYVWGVYSNGNFSHTTFDYDNSCGVRPVISLES